MSNTRPEADIARAKGLRDTAKRIADPEAKQSFLDAAARVEKNAAKKVRKVGRRPAHRRPDAANDLPPR